MALVSCLHAVGVDCGAETDDNLAKLAAALDAIPLISQEDDRECLAGHEPREMIRQLLSTLVGVHHLKTISLALP